MTVTPAPPRLRRLVLPVVLAVAAFAVAACGPSGPTPTPVPSVAPVDSPAAAVDAVRARVPLFDGFGPRDPDLIGQAAFWTAEADGATWRVTFETGWGDCQAGCIDRHTWTWDVAADGTLAFVGEAGSPLTEDTLAALRAAATTTGVGGRATGGPTCPVERPGDPACEPRLVGGVTLVVKDAGGSQVALVTTDGSGFFRAALPPGDYTLDAPPVEGFMSGPKLEPFSVADGVQTWLDVTYDTGMR